jgi:hypothetical protein
MPTPPIASSAVRASDLFARKSESIRAWFRMSMVLWNLYGEPAMRRTILIMAVILFPAACMEHDGESTGVACFDAANCIRGTYCKGGDFAERKVGEYWTHH